MATAWCRRRRAWKGWHILRKESLPELFLTSNARQRQRSKYDWIRVHRPELQQRVILMSGDTANNKTQALLANSGIPFIEKPFRLEQLISMVESTFGKP